MKTIAIFNNKGGVGKTTYMYHVAHLLAARGKTVLMVDCDSQCNLTAYSLRDQDIKKSWAKDGNSIFRNIEPVFQGLGDIRDRKPSRVVNSRGELYIIPGDLQLTDFEDTLGDTWNAARGGSEAAVRAQSAIHRCILNAGAKVNADLVLIDLGPNLGALNRSVLASADYFITPVAPDLFSLQGTENLGRKLAAWRQGWDQVHSSSTSLGFPIPAGKAKYLGYVIQQHNVRSNPTGMTKGWEIYGKELFPAIKKNIIDTLSPSGQVIDWGEGDFELGKIQNLHSLIPYSMDAKKPIFYCNGSDGLNGSHITKARDSSQLFMDIVQTLEAVIDPEFL
ncbi:ParA family protein [Tritonibacter sp. SIMBA_163]|uniref:ParA family protein n=1 Tax=Tritonibacter sp. SIMBA_163 TaxID=3080868 RepID=UPI0039805239